MREATDVCIAFLGNRVLGNQRMVFEHLAWWLTRRGVTEATRLQDDPAWNEPLIVGFDADGNPMELREDAADGIMRTLSEVASEPLPLAEAQDLVLETVESGLRGAPMDFTNRWEKARVDMLRHIYDDRRKTWPEAG